MLFYYSFKIFFLYFNRLLSPSEMKQFAICDTFLLCNSSKLKAAVIKIFIIVMDDEICVTSKMYFKDI